VLGAFGTGRGERDWVVHFMSRLGIDRDCSVSLSHLVLVEMILVCVSTEILSKQGKIQVLIRGKPYSTHLATTNSSKVSDPIGPASHLRSILVSAHNKLVHLFFPSQ